MSTLYQAIENAGSPIQQDGETVTKAFVFGDDFIGFDGHFPESPILPAMVQLMLGEVTAREAIGKPLTVISSARAKFVRQVIPGETLLATLGLTPGDETVKASVTLTVDGEIASSYALTMALSE